MKPNPEEQKVLGFVALLLVLSAAARFGAGQGATEAQLVTDAQPVDVPALVREDSALEERARSRARPLAAGEKLSLNRATVDELQRLPGVGPSTAAAILAWRDSAGPFRTPDDLLHVKGIGPARLAKLSPLVQP